MRLCGQVSTYVIVLWMMEKISELKLFCVVNTNDPPVELVRKRNGQLFEKTIEVGPRQHLVLFGLGPWDHEKSLQVELSAANSDHVTSVGQVSSKCRCLYWENVGNQMKAGGAMRLSCTVVDDHTKTVKPKKGKTDTKSLTTNQTECLKNEEKLTKSKRKSEEVSVEKTKQSSTNSKPEVIVKRQCKGLNKEGQKQSTRAKKEEGKKSSESESSDCQSPSNGNPSKDTVGNRLAKRDMPKRACMSKTAIDAKETKQKCDLDQRPLKDKDMNIMSDLDTMAEKEVLNKMVDEVKEEQIHDVTPAVVAVQSQRKLSSSVSPSKRWGHSLCMISENEAVLIGGQGDKQLFCKDSIWHLDLEKGKWTSQGKTTSNQKPDMRMGHTAIYDPTVSSIYIYGGSKNLKWFSDIQVIGTDDWQWQMVKANGKAPARAYHSGTLYRHELWVFGGVYPRPDPQPDGCSNDIHVFNPMDESWYEPIVNGIKPAPRSGHSATLLQDRLVVFGGWDAPVCFNDLHVLDLGIVEWIQPQITGTPPSPRSWHASCALAGSRVLIHGGYNGNNALDDTFIFNLECATWTRVEMPLPRQPRTGHSALCLPYKHSNDGHDEVVVFGGGDNDGAFFQDLDFFMVPLESKVNKQDTNTT